MAKVSSIQKNLYRMQLEKKYRDVRSSLKKIQKDKQSTVEERMIAQSRFEMLPRNSSVVRIRNRSKISGRPRGYYGWFGLSRIEIREFGLQGLIPGLTKASW